MPEQPRAAVEAALRAAKAYAASALLAKQHGAFTDFLEVRERVMAEIEEQRRTAYALLPEGVPTLLIQELRTSWDDVLDLGYRYGFHQPIPLPSKQEMPLVITPVISIPVEAATLAPTPVSAHAPRRRRLSDERRSITHKFVIGSHQGYITVGLYDDGTPGEVFVKMAKEGSVISGMMDAFATSVSIGLQYGVPLQVLVNKFVHTRFEPSGPTNNPSIKIAKSIVDYIFRWLAMKFLSAEAQMAVGINSTDDGKPGTMPAPMAEAQSTAISAPVDAAPQTLFPPSNGQPDVPCTACGSMTVRYGEGHKCLNCGAVTA